MKANDDTPVTVSNCVIQANDSGDNGGGIAVAGGHDVAIQLCRIVNNNALGRRGGGVYVGGSGFRTVLECVVSNNTANTGGGGLACTDSGFLASGCLVVDNVTETGGGGLHLGWGGNIHNSLIAGNRASNGGGVFSDYRGDVVNCTIVDNFAGAGGGGVHKVELRNSIVWSNTAVTNENLFREIAVNSCSPDLTPGVNGNINADPQFINPAGGDYRLSATSPCINWGNNGYVLSSEDLDGNPRIVEDHVDMGCYEYQGILGLADSDGDGLPDDWERTWCGGNADPNRDDDGDRHNNFCEWICGMDPASAASVFAVTTATPTATPTGSFVLEWPCVTGRWYNVLWAPGLTNDYQSLEDFIEHPQNSYTDTTHAVESSGFYKVEVRMK